MELLIILIMTILLIRTFRKAEYFKNELLLREKAVNALLGHINYLKVEKSIDDLLREVEEKSR